MNKAKKILFFLDISPHFERAFEAAHELGFDVYLITTDSSLPIQSSLYKQLYYFPTITIQSVNSVIEKDFPNVSSQIAGFWSLKEWLIGLATQLNPIYCPDALYFSKQLWWLTKNKFEMRELLKNSNFNPSYALLDCSQSSTESLIKSFLNKASVVKPLLGYSSIGVEKVNPNDNLIAAIERSSSILKKFYHQFEDEIEPTTYDLKNTLLIEEFIEGTEFSVEIFAQSGHEPVCIGICGKSPMQPPFFEEISYLLPANISDELKSKLSSAGVEVMKTLGLTSGMAHLEFIVKPRGDIKLLDIGLRLGGGGLTHDLIYYSSGIDMVKAILAELTGLPSSPYLETKEKNSTLLYLIQVGQGGEIKSLPYPDFDLQDDAKLIRLHYAVNPGDITSTYPNYSGHPGYALFKVFGQGKEADTEIQKILTQASSSLNIHYEL